ncbi:transposase, partial [Virgibacillus dakarensis]|nr:transposase [Virgibacillus dakarensis]
VLSDGKSYENPTFIRKTEKKRKRAQAKLSKMKRGSANYVKQIIKVRSLHEKVANQRRDFLHKLSYHLAKDYSIIAVEDLDIRHMVKNKRLSKSISDAGWGTSQDCSTCGTRVKKSLSIRTHICKGCGTILDRDHNASLNILRKGMEQLDQMVAID